MNIGRKTLLYLSVFFIFFSFISTKQALGAVEDPPMVKLFLELYKSKDKNISLGSMLLSINMYNSKNLENFLKASIKDEDSPAEKCIKLYTLSKLTADYSDMKNFIESFPDNSENFWELINFECKVTRCPHSSMLRELIDFANMDYEVINEKDIELQNIANKKLKQIIPLADGWVSESIHALLHNK